MKIYYGTDDFTPVRNAVVTSGTFDGVHVGHQKILRRLKEAAEKLSGESIVITFWPHPRHVLKPEDSGHLLLNTFEEKAELLRAQGVHHLLRIAFTREFSQLTSQDFIRDILVDKIGTKKLVIGYDHRFGKNREGSFDELKVKGPAYGFEVEEIPRQDVDNVGVSSTRIRNALTAGDIDTATHFLGRPYSMNGRVIKGEKLGRMLGYPTANIDVDSHLKLVPAHGIYAAIVEVGQVRYRGMLYIGNRPTIDGVSTSIEVNIFEFDREIYGENIKVEFLSSIRQDSRFDDLEKLKLQMARDKEAALKALAGISL
jgi:riboflavin kinase/FMN adenylyltransferase